ncbi:MAG: DUF2815 family protein [Candidatus Thiodiazotropha endolucinida]|nr:DUF2815 family protein [Candidatus Thiodiazotropha taylori]MCW4344854.1 DUF2815 family protein [Candidatus Thiodiazotropha endolucinida]
MKQVTSNPMIIQRAIIRYPHCHTPHSFNASKNDGDAEDAKYSAKLYVEQNHIAELAKAVKQCAIDAFGTTGTGIAMPLHPVSEDGKDAAIEQLKNMYYVNVKSSKLYPPRVVDINRQPVKEEDLNSGNIVAAIVRPYPWESRFGKGVSVGLNGILKLEEGTPFVDNYDSMYDEIDEKIIEQAKQADRERQNEALKSMNNPVGELSDFLNS